MHLAITEELIWLLHRERVNAGVRARLVSQVAKKSREENCRVKGVWRPVPLSVRPTGCR